MGVEPQAARVTYIGLMPRRPRRVPPSALAPVPGLAPLAPSQDGLSITTGLEIVTGEAVALDMAPASLPTRTVGRLVDVLISIVLLVGGSAVVSQATKHLEDAYQAAAALAVTVGATTVFPLLFEALSRGRTPGKMLFGLRVVRDDAGPIRLRHAVVRALVGTVEIFVLFGFPAIVCAAINRHGKRFGDLLAGTYVVTERHPPRQTVPLSMPPALAGWAAGIDLGRIPDPLARAARDVLGRTPTMDPRAAQGAVAELAAALLPHVSPGPPPGTPNDAFIAAVLVERRRRDTERLTRARHRLTVREPELRGLPYGL